MCAVDGRPSVGVAGYLGDSGGVGCSSSLSG